MVREVFIKMKAFIEICKYSSQFASNYMDKSKWAESIGYLFCRRDGNRYIIEDAVGMSRGSETYVTMSPEQLAMIEKLERDRPNCFLGGWWHTHPNLSPFFSDTDVMNQMFYQAQNEDGLGIVFDHSMVAPDFVGFKIFRLDDAQDPNTKYHDVEWKPLDWTEAGLEEAFKPIGISARVIENLAFKIEIRKKLPQEELPAFIMPKTASDAQSKQMIENCHKNSAAAYQKKDIMQALVTKRIEVALLGQYNDIEPYADAILEFVTWALQVGKFMSAESVLNRLEVLFEEKKIPEDLANYYTGKMQYGKGQILQAQFRFSNAIEAFDKALSAFEPEDYFEDCFKCAYHIAECCDFQKEIKKAIEWCDKATKYAQSAINDAKDNEEMEEEDIKELQMYLTTAQRLQTRLRAKLGALTQGPTRIV